MSAPPVPRKAGVALAAFAAIAALAFVAYVGSRDRQDGKGIDPHDSAQVARGRVVYAERCAACHGANLEGQPDWRKRLPNGRLPAPPHDGSGHTWHHPDEVLFGIVKHGLVPPYAPRGYASDMPAFGPTLTDQDIRAVLGYIESKWSPEIVKMRTGMIGR